MQFIPSHATAVILYGREACARLGRMLAHWDTILSRDDWNQYLFVMIGDDPPVPDIPSQARHALPGNILKLPPAELSGAPETIIRKLRDRIENNTVCLQLIVSPESSGDSPQTLLDWVGDIQADFGPGGQYTVCYLLCGGQSRQPERQREFAQLFTERAADFPYVYLLGEFAQDGSTVREALSWRAVHSEALINSSDMRKLTRGVPCSLGYAALNANDQELEAIRLRAAVRYLQTQAGEPMLLQTAWEILTQRADPFPGLEGAELFPAVKAWLDQIAAQLTVFPTEAERRNNRVFSGLYRKEKSPPEIQQSLERFYQVNCGLSAKSEEAQARFVREQRKTISTRLAARIAAGAFPERLLIAVEAALAAAEAVPAELTLPAWERKAAFTSRTEHLNRQCEAAEAALHRYYQAVQRRRCAQSVREILAGVRAFIRNARTLPGTLDRLLSGLHTPQRLEEKYNKYFTQVQRTIDRSRGALQTEDAGQPRYGAEGLPLTDTWREIVRRTAADIQRALPPECTGTFCKIVQWEYSTKDGLNSFFNNYLAGSRRMLEETYDMPGSAQSLYIMDSAFAAHHWARENKSRILTARNDNVERIDLYPLQKDLRWYLDNNRYFQPAGEPQPGAQEPAPIFDGRVPAAEAPEPARETAAKEPDAPADATHGIRVHFVENRYVLSWDWETGANHAVIILTEPMGQSRIIPCGIQDFNAPVHGVPGGIDVTASLPYGRVGVEIRSQNGLYAYKDISGKKRGVTYRFGSGVLKLSGQPEDIRRLFVKGKRDDGRFVLYPLDVKSGRADAVIAGFALHGGASLVTDPDDLFPTNYAQRI